MLAGLINSLLGNPAASVLSGFGFTSNLLFFFGGVATDGCWGGGVPTSLGLLIGVGLTGVGSLELGLLSGAGLPGIDTLVLGLIGAPGIGIFPVGGFGSLPLVLTSGVGGLRTEIVVPAIVVAPIPQIINRTK
jgi:hypothetical protein